VTRQPVQNLRPAFSLDSYCTVAMPGIVACQRGSGTGDPIFRAHLGHGPPDNHGTGGLPRTLRTWQLLGEMFGASGSLWAGLLT
jgi:hypothetical protein